MTDTDSHLISWHGTHNPTSPSLSLSEQPTCLVLSLFCSNTTALSSHVGSLPVNSSLCFDIFSCRKIKKKEVLKEMTQRVKSQVPLPITSLCLRLNQCFSLLAFVFLRKQCCCFSPIFSYIFILISFHKTQQGWCWCNWVAKVLFWVTQQIKAAQGATKLFKPKLNYFVLLFLDGEYVMWVKRIQHYKQ